MLQSGCELAGTVEESDFPSEIADDSVGADDDETFGDSVVKPTTPVQQPVVVDAGATTSAPAQQTTAPVAQPTAPAQQTTAPVKQPTAPVASAPAPTAPTAPATASKTLQVSGRKILDTCGQPWVARGVEQLAGKAFSADGTYANLASELIKTGSNAVRILPQIAEVTASDLDAMLSAFEQAKVVVYISPGDRSWFKRKEIRDVLVRHEKALILDAFQEPNYDDVPRWIREAKAAIAELRSAGYAAPLTVLGSQYGRDLPNLLEHGQEIVDADPLHNTILGWQAYWGNGGWYQKQAGMSLAQAVEKSATMNFPVQVGIDLYADANDPMDYQTVMAASQKSGVSWLWWNFWNKWDGMGNNASTDGTAAHLTTAGKTFIQDDANSIAKTSKKACFR